MYISVYSNTIWTVCICGLMWGHVEGPRFFIISYILCTPISTKTYKHVWSVAMCCCLMLLHSWRNIMVRQKQLQMWLTHIVCPRLHVVIVLGMSSDGFFMFSLTGTLHHTCYSSVREQTFYLISEQYELCLESWLCLH